VGREGARICKFGSNKPEYASKKRSKVNEYRVTLVLIYLLLIGFWVT